VTVQRWTIRFLRRADKDMERLDPQVRERLLVAIDRLAADDPSLDIRRLVGSEQFRMRVGDWRLRFTRDTETQTVLVDRVLPRGRAYDR
jgi:mRNA interferase RelE/StbE